jgi:disease resistance protein RPM1
MVLHFHVDRYFVVIDDVWEVEAWEIIKLALVENNYGSKVIATTRNFDVAKEAGEVYKLKPLSYDDSMKLFYTRISGASGKCLHNQQDDFCNKILRKCAGIPLAIITMSSLLAGKPECEWYEVYNSIGSPPKDNREVEDTMTILSFSYYDLPPYLRTCLLYLSTYPEDYLIEKEPLIWKWIAEGFIDGKQGTRLFDLGERYFNNLINRSLIQVEETWDGKVLGCRVHDMVLDLMRKLSFEENFIALLDDNVEGTPAPSSVHRLAHHHRILGHINSEAMATGMEKVRSYTAFMCCIDNRDQFSRFKLLRVLDILECSFKEGCHLEHLGDLLHLRYLGIRRCQGIPELPEQIGNLKLLQTLDVDVRLPASIVQLTKLVRLCAEHTHAPYGIGNLTSLEVLRIGNTNRLMKELRCLCELRVLEFSSGGMDENTQKDFVESLHNLKKIEHIVLGSFASRADTTMWEAAGFVLPRPLCYLHLLIYFSKMPSCINSLCLPNLSHLILRVNTMYEQDLKILARLPMLCFLYLGTKSTVTGSNINVSDGCFFEKLRFFKTNQMVKFEQPHEDDGCILFHMWNGEGAMPFGPRKSSNSSKAVPSHVMPNLEVLTFDIRLRAIKVNNGDCGNIGIEYLPSLQKLSGWIHLDGVPPAEGGAALAALRNACKVHPNNPTLDMRTYNEVR